MNDRDDWTGTTYIVYGIATAIILAMIVLSVLSSIGCKPPDPIVLPLEECPYEEPIDVQVAFRDACDATPVDLDVVQIDGEEVERFLNDNDIYEFGCVEDESVHDVLALADGYVGVHNEPFRVEGGSLVVRMEPSDGCLPVDDDDDVEATPVNLWGDCMAEVYPEYQSIFDAELYCCDTLGALYPEVAEICGYTP